MTPCARMARSVALALALTAPPAPADSVVIVADDPAMAAAIETAQSHLSRVFGAVMDPDGKAHPALTLKVAFPVEGGAEKKYGWPTWRVRASGSPPCSQTNRCTSSTSPPATR